MRTLAKLSWGAYGLVCVFSVWGGTRLMFHSRVAAPLDAFPLVAARIPLTHNPSGSPPVFGAFSRETNNGYDKYASMLSL